MFQKAGNAQAHDPASVPPLQPPNASDTTATAAEKRNNASSNLDDDPQTAASDALDLDRGQGRGHQESIGHSNGQNLPWIQERCQTADDVFEEQDTLANCSGYNASGQMHTSKSPERDRVHAEQSDVAEHHKDMQEGLGSAKIQSTSRVEDTSLQDKDGKPRAPGNATSREPCEKPLQSKDQESSKHSQSPKSVDVEADVDMTGIDLAEQNRILKEIWMQRSMGAGGRTAKRPKVPARDKLPKQPRLTDMFKKSWIQDSVLDCILSLLWNASLKCRP